MFKNTHSPSFQPQGPLILGADPGLSGALAVYDTGTDRVLHATSLPLVSVTCNAKSKRALDTRSLVTSIRTLSSAYPGITGVIELVNAMRGQGVTSMFTFGYGRGALEAAFHAAEIPFILVTPQKWKTAIGCPTDKNAALVHATKIMPESADWWTPVRRKRTKDQCKGIAEAAMIARYGKHVAALAWTKSRKAA